MRLSVSSWASTSYSTSSGLTSTRQKSQGAPQPLPPHMRPGTALRKAATDSLPDRCSGTGSSRPAGCDPVIVCVLPDRGRSGVRPDPQFPATSLYHISFCAARSGVPAGASRTFDSVVEYPLPRYRLSDMVRRPAGARKASLHLLLESFCRGFESHGNSRRSLRESVRGAKRTAGAAATGVVTSAWQNTPPGAWRTGPRPLPASTGRNSSPFRGRRGVRAGWPLRWPLRWR